MANINLQCGHCGKTMAVEESALGRQVRCPHCQQVVQTPAPSGLVPTSSMPAPENWGSESMPPPPLPRLSAEEEQRLYGATNSPPETVTEPTHEQVLGGSASSELHWLNNAQNDQPAEYTPVNDPLGLGQPSPATGDESFVPPPTQIKVRNDQTKWLILIIVLVTLISLSFFSTAAAFILWNKLNNARKADPFERMLDEGQPMPDPDRSMPGNLRQPIGATVSIGGLEVTGRRIERRLVSVANNEPDKDTAKEALVLHLHIRNVSDDEIKPLDFYFDRRWTTNDRDTSRPYTLVELAKRTFYGGPLRAPSEPRHQELVKRQEYAFLLRNDNDPASLTLKQDHNRVLKPHESFDTWLCTDCNNPLVIQTVDAQKKLESGKFRWRVHVRRSLESVNGKEVWATAVIAFEFTPDEVHEVN